MTNDTNKEAWEKKFQALLATYLDGIGNPSNIRTLANQGKGDWTNVAAETLRKAERDFERDVQNGFPDVYETYVWDSVAQALEETANQKLKEGMERALECKPERREQKRTPDLEQDWYENGGFNNGIDTYATAIKEEIDKLTQ